MSDETVTDWIAALKSGDERAAREMWARYFGRVADLARAKMGAAPRRVADEEDVALSVFDSLCEGAARGRFPDLRNRDDLWALLVTITQQKVVDLLRHNTRQKRGGGDVCGESAFLSPGDGKTGGIDQFAGEVMPPELVVMLDETQSLLLERLRDDTLRSVARWKMRGHSNQEIALKLGIGERAVERKLQLIRASWSRELDK
jgi:DNA-directed RNA polymerase specialized sigma24 family protein